MLSSTRFSSVSVLQWGAVSTLFRRRMLMADLYDVIDPASLRRRLLVYDPNSVASTVSLSGSFALNDANTTTAMSFQDAVNGALLKLSLLANVAGTFTFSNGTSSLSTGSIVCYRDPSWAWYQQSGT
jgi:hypothetical protein